MNSFEVQEKRKHELSDFQRNLIVGTILGDGHLLKTTRGYCLRINHGIKQKEYVDWKHSALKEISMEPKVYKGVSYHFRTVTHQTISKYRDIFYRDKTKIVPDELKSLLSPVALAVWIMDDGTNELGHSRSLRLNTQCFSLEEQYKLIGILEKVFQIRATINKDKSNYRLRIRTADMPLLRKIVNPYMLDSMNYKISP